MFRGIKDFTSTLKGVLGKPPYLVFIFVGAVFVVISLISGNYFNRTWIFFLYSVAGLIWRYIEKDIDSGFGKVIKGKKGKNWSHLIIIFLYHFGNIILLLLTLFYLLPKPL